MSSHRNTYCLWSDCLPLTNILPMAPARPLLIALLCGLTTFGHVPAWLHVAHCDHNHSGDSAQAEASRPSSCGHSCCQHHARPVEPESPSNESHDDHDSDSCVICQSLAMLGGLSWRHEPILAHTLCDEQVVARSTHTLGPTSLSLPHPRGPPTL